MQKLHLLTCATKGEIDKFPDAVGSVVFYIGEAEDLTGNTPNEELNWELVGLDMKLKHGKDNTYLVMDQ